MLSERSFCAFRHTRCRPFCGSRCIMTALQGCARFLQVIHFGVSAPPVPRRVALARGCDLDQPSCKRVPGEIKALAMGRQPKAAVCKERPAWSAPLRACRHPFDVACKRAFRKRKSNSAESERAPLLVVSSVETKRIRHWRKRGCNDGLIRLHLLRRRSDIQALAVARHASQFQGKWRKALSQSKY
jgi:hypothetical protein